FEAEDGIRDRTVTGVQTCALPISLAALGAPTEYPAALRTAGRLAVGPALFVALRREPSVRIARLGRLFAITGAVAAGLGIAEVQIGRAAGRERGGGVGGSGRGRDT